MISAISALIFGTVLAILAIWTIRLVGRGRAARKSLAPSGKLLRAMEHKDYALKLAFLTLFLCAAVPIAAHFLHAGGPRRAPYWLFVANRVLLAILVPLGAVLILWLHGLKKGNEKLHRILGWSAVGTLAGIVGVGMALYYEIYL